MMLNPITGLINSCVSLFKYRKETSRNLFTDFVAPAFADFEVVHKDYLETFNKYRKLLKSTEAPLTLNHPVFDEINIDNLFSASNRAKLWQLEDVVDDPIYGKFILAILRYIRFDTNWKPAKKPRLAASALTQVVRNTAAKRVRLKINRFSREDMKRNAAMNTLDDVIKTIQENHASVTKEYFKLKEKLLKPKKIGRRLGKDAT